MTKISSTISLLSFLFLSTVIYAQKISVNSAEERVDGTPRTGLSTVVILEQQDIEKAWVKHLKEYGKVEAKNGNYIVDKVIIPSISTSSVKLYSTTIASKEGTKIFLAVDLGKEYVTSATEREYTATQKILHDFAVKAYRDDINVQIADAEKALANSVKNQEKKFKDSQTLATNLEKNRQQKVQLEEQLKKNADENVQLLQLTEQNKLDQKAAAEDVEKMKIAIDRIRGKLNAIE